MENPSSLFVEKRSEGSGIHFEPGIHPTTQREVDSLHQAFANGDLDAHVWNPQVGERIASYAYDKPGLLVTIDSLAPNPPSSYPFFTPLQEATDVWISLPSRPNNLNHTNSVYVLKGDSLYYRLPQAILPTQKEPESIRKQMETLTATQEGAISQTLQSEIYGQATATLALGVVLWGASKLLEQKMSRRKFLSTGIAAGTTAFLGGEILRNVLPDIAADAPTEPTKDFLQTVDAVARSGLTQPVFVAGRTASLIAKAEDAQKIAPQFSEMASSIVMGSEHTDMASIYMQDRVQRNKAIAGYAQQLLNVAKQVYAEYYHIQPDALPPQVRQLLLDYLSEADIVKVADPGGPSFQPRLAQAIDKDVTPVKRFTSPQMDEAIKNLH